MKIDSHLHVYPDLKSFFIESKTHESSPSKLKKIFRKVIIPYNTTLHLLQEKSRLLPEKYIPYSDRLIALFGTIPTLVDSTEDSLLHQMDKNNLDAAVVIAHPPFISNEFVLKLSQRHKGVIPIVNIEKNELDPAEVLERYIVSSGARGLKIHPAADGFQSDDEHYHKLLKIADQYKLPVIIHTGCIHIKPFYKDPELGHVHHYESWFEMYPNCKFILAHMNYHYPSKAISLLKKYTNVYADTSWQPIEVIKEAVDTLGSEKLMFGSDWPLVGENITYCLSHIEKLSERGEISTNQYNDLMGLTAKKIFLTD